jgi:hypothetical protein
VSDPERRVGVRESAESEPEFFRLGSERFGRYEAPGKQNNSRDEMYLVSRHDAAS